MDIQSSQLKNGLIVASEAMPALRSVSIGVWIKCGSRFEDERVAGISHFIEHLLFKGTRRRSAKDIAEEIDSVGGQLDAFTDREYVGIYAKVLDEHLPLAFALLADIVQNPSFPADELKRERNVISEEISMVEDSPQELIQDIYMESFWKGHALGRAVSGTRESVAGLGRNDVLRYFKEHYTAANMVISIAGSIRHRDVLELARRHFGCLEPGLCRDPGPAPGASASRVVRRKPHLEQMHLCLGTACPSILSKDRYKMHILCNILGGGMSSRLFQKIREERGLVYSIYSSLNLFQDAGALLVYAATAPENAAKVARMILREFRNLRDCAVGADELKRAKQNIKGSIMLSLESSSSRMTHLAQQMIYYGRFYELSEILDSIECVRARDIRTLVQGICDTGVFSIAALGSRDGRDLKSMKFGF